MRAYAAWTQRNRIVAGVLLVGLAGGDALAADVDKRFRLALSVGSGAPTDEIRSNSANVLSLLNEDGTVEDRLIDPRDDAAIAGVLEAESGGLATLSFQYALSPLILLEARVGYQTHDVGEIEVQEVRDFPQVVGVPAGELTRVPLQLNGLVRFRPHASFNPYIGGGIGYSIIDFEMSPELHELSSNLELSRGKPTRLGTENIFNIIFLTQVPLRQLQGAEVDTGNAFEWQIAGGAELGLTDRWAAFLDLGYVFTNAALRIGFDGAEDLGVGVPQGATPLGSDLFMTEFGPLQIVEGGALDLTDDGVPDPGFYYIEGGRLRLDGFTFQLGIRYTF